VATPKARVETHLQGLRHPGRGEDSPIGAAFKLLQGATMPNGQKYEDWLKDKKASGKYEKNE
jgi:hypothetical protein